MKNHLNTIYNNLYLIFILSIVTGPVAAVETGIDVRVLSRGAKFIGTSMGGVQITLHDVQTGELLSRGVTRGGTGDTDRIMNQTHTRNGVLATESAAVFSTVLDLGEPRLIEVTAYGPLAQHQAANTITATQWVIPGKHLTGGNGWLLEMPGFVVDVLEPPAHQALTGLPQQIVIRANVTKMCGCPLTPDGLWDANQYEVQIRLNHNGEFADEYPMRYGGKASQFEGTLELDQPGSYEATVYAYDPETGNTGLDTTTFNLSPE